MTRNLLQIIFSLIIICHGLAIGQSLEEITRSGRFLYAFGTGSSFDDADRNALQNLSSQISVNVESRFTSQATEMGNRVTRHSEDYTHSYSGISLQMAKSRLTSEKKGEMVVVRYIELTDLDRVFYQRRIKTLGFYEQGKMATEELRISDALRNYYWSLVLLNSLPGKDTIRYYSGGKPNVLLISALPDIVNGIFSQLRIGVSKIEIDDAEKQKLVFLSVNFRDKPVENFDFSYWTGTMYQLLSTTDGMAMAELLGAESADLQNLDIRAEYKFRNKTTWDTDLTTIFESISLPAFDKANYKVNIDKRRIKKSPSQDSVVSRVLPEGTRQTSRQARLTGENEISSFQLVINSVLTAMQKKNLHSCSTYFTAECYDLMMRLVSNGKVRVLDTSPVIKPVVINNCVEFRSVPCKFSYANNKREFIENLVFRFDSAGLITNVAFSLGNRTLHDILNRSENFGSTEDKHSVISFLENYKTAYSLKRLDYIESVFADNALIIVGSTLKEAEPIDQLYLSAGDKNFKAVRLGKQEYMERLRRVFDLNEYVNIQFEETSLKKINGREKIYGIQLEQHYFSSNYADKGYLFLMIDLRDSLKPKIYVRTWQPQKNEDGTIFGLGDFHF